MNVDDCLPDELRGPDTTITRIAAGLSGAGVYRVEAAGQTFVLKIANDEPLEDWRRKLRLRQLAADAGVAPRVVHVDEARRAIVSAFVDDRSFFAFYASARDVALAQLGRTLRRVHDLPLPADATAQDPREVVGGVWSGLADVTLPAFVGDAVRRLLAEPAPAREIVVSHNDVNPTNLVYDGDTVMLLDWDVAAPNDRYYDLAAIAVFLRMDDASCRALLTAHDGAPVGELPAAFRYARRLVAILCGIVGVRTARQDGHAGATGELDSTLSLADFYQQLRSGALSLAALQGRWAFGLALIKESFAL